MYSVIRIGDFIICTCTPPRAATFTGPPPPPCPNGSVSQGSFDTFIEDKGAARVGDQTSNCCGGECFCPNRILTGSSKTFINNKPAVRVIDTVSCGKFTTGSNRTFIN